MKGEGKMGLTSSTGHSPRWFSRIRMPRAGSNWGPDTGPSPLFPGMGGTMKGQAGKTKGLGRDFSSCFLKHLKEPVQAIVVVK